jgi:hypothetical protein
MTHQKCGGKNCYASKKEAETAGREQELSDLKNETKISVYRCQFCGKWHLTSALPKNRKSCYDVAKEE